MTRTQAQIDCERKPVLLEMAKIIEEHGIPPKRLQNRLEHPYPEDEEEKKYCCSIVRLNRKIKKLFAGGEKEALEKLQELNLATTN